MTRDRKIKIKDWRENLKQVDIVLIATAIVLVAIGVLALYAMSSGEESDGSYLKKQLVWIFIGLILMVALALFNYSSLRNYIVIIYGANILFLFTVFIKGRAALGAQRWIQVGSFSFQPSELSKILIILTLGAYLAERKGDLSDWRDVLRAIVYMIPPILLIVLQPDLGTALVLVAITIGMLMVAGITPKQILILALVAYLLIGFVIKLDLLQDYQMERLVVFFNPSVDPLGSGYNLRQSMIAIGSGGILGKGLFSNTQSRLNFLPAAVRHTDFIFAVIGEEMGFIGSVLVIVIFFLIMSRVIQIAVSSRNYFGLLVATGIGSMWIFQVLVNIGMTIGIMPVTGIPLPFISYGGSAMLVNMASVGLLLSIYRRRWS